jgi:2-polyprenyl-3-methyl-5-hydroxy-6-metoxy-1,4-benzoquinol methylase
MATNLFELGADIDVDALMSRVRENVKQRGTAVTIAPSPKDHEQRSLNTLRTQRVTQEMDIAGAYAEAINQTPLKARGTKGRVEFRVKKFLKWLVHWNTQGQADFNHSVMTSFGLIVEDLQTGQDNFATVEDLLRDIAGQSSELERKMNRGLEEIRQDMQSELGAAVGVLREDLDRIAIETRMLTQQVRDSSAILEEIDSRSDDASANLAALEKKMVRMIEESAQRLEESTQHLQTDFGAAEATLREQMDQLLRDQVGGFSAILEDFESRRLAAAPKLAALEHNADRLIHEFRAVEAILRKRSLGLDGNLDHALDELRIRILRAERFAGGLRLNIGTAAEPSTSSEEGSDRKANIRHQRPNGREKAATVKQPPPEEPFGQTFDYFLFEHKFRGSLSEIKRRQRVYLDLFLGKQRVLDLGCGRGEFVELLSENEVGITGVDSDQDMVDFCNERGLRVVQADVFEYLGDLPDASLDGISGLQIIEHLPFEQILELIKLCEDKLKAGGVIVIESVNTNCPAALGNFYLDPSHIRPVPAQTLQFMVEQRLFKVQCLKFMTPVIGSSVNEELEIASGWSLDAISYQDYALIAHKV